MIDEVLAEVMREQPAKPRVDFGDAPPALPDWARDHQPLLVADDDADEGNRVYLPQPAKPAPEPDEPEHVVPLWRPQRVRLIWRLLVQAATAVQRKRWSERWVCRLRKAVENSAAD